MQRYFVPFTAWQNKIVAITGEDYHHIKQVMRMKQGDLIIISDGNLNDYYAEIREITNEKIILQVTEPILINREAKVLITLAQGLPKGEKWELILQKGTELGVSTFLPFSSERTIVKIEKEKEEKKKERWRKIVKEASEQAQRSIIPNILPVISFSDLLLQIVKYDFAILAYEEATEQTLFQVIEKNKRNITNESSILLIIGPEGGFTPSEVESAAQRGVKIVSLGQRILRTETASIVAVANILYHIEN